jgi:hypothetical protein
MAPCECAPDDKLRVSTIVGHDSGGHGAKRAFAYPAMLFTCEKHDQQDLAKTIGN